MKPESDDFPASPQATFQLPGPVSQLALSTDGTLIVAAEKTTLHFWNPAQDSHQVLNDHTASITSVVLGGEFVLVADASGVIRSWNTGSLREQWSIRSSAAIRALAILPESRMFLYAGSRGGESADILAYQLPPKDQPTSRPERLGQLRLPRNRNLPPECIAVSPDEQLLLIGNSRDGELIVLPRRSADELGGRDFFPFAHAADLQEAMQEYLSEQDDG